MARDRATKSSGGGHGDHAADSGGRDPRQMAMMQRAHDRKKAGGQSNAQSSSSLAEARAMLKGKVGGEMRETMYAALDIFQSMVRADERHEAIVSAGFSKVVAHKITDFLQAGALDLAKDAFELGETIVGGPISTVFHTAKGQLEAAADLKAKLTASEAVDKIVAQARAATDRACKAAEAAVDKISDEKMAEIAGILDLFENVKSASDSEREGSLKHGLQQWSMERMGAPKTGGAAMHERAVALYEVYTAEVSKTKPVRQQVGDIEDATSGKTHQHAEDEAREAEGRLGVEGEVEKDTNERARVETEAGE